MITPMYTQDIINNFLKEDVASKILLKTYIKKENAFKMKNPQVVSGFILPKGAKESALHDESEDFPYIGTRILKVRHKNDGAVITLKILCGAFCPGSIDKNNGMIEDSSGYRDIWNLIEAVRISLCSKGAIEKKCRINPETFMAEMPEEQPYPYWEGWAMTEWDVLMPMRLKREPYSCGNRF